MIILNKCTCGATPALFEETGKFEGAEKTVFKWRVECVECGRHTDTYFTSAEDAEANWNEGNIKEAD